MSNHNSGSRRSPLFNILLYRAAGVAGLVLLFVLLFRAAPFSVLTPEADLVEEVVEVPVEEVVPVVQDATATLVVAGDIMAHDAVTQGAYNAETDTYDFTGIFTYAGTLLQDADLTIANLETTFGGTVSGYPNFSSPDELADSLKTLGFDLLATANNHCLDTGTSGAHRTLEILDAKGIDHIGTYDSQADFDKDMGIVVEEVNGISIAFLDYTYGTNYYTTDEAYLVNRYNSNTEDESEDGAVVDTDKLDREMAYARSLETDMIMVILHWGTEYQTGESSYQNEIADYLIARGADAVLGGHPHVLQPMEFRTVTDIEGRSKTGFVCYSLGNLISNMSASNTYYTILLNLEISRKDGETSISGVSYEPMYMLNPGNSGTSALYLLDIPEVLSNSSNPYYSMRSRLEESMAAIRRTVGTDWDVTYDVMQNSATESAVESTEPDSTTVSSDSEE